MLSRIDVKVSNDELEDVIGGCVYPDVEVFLLEDVVVEDDVNGL